MKVNEVPDGDAARPVNAVLCYRRPTLHQPLPCGNAFSLIVAMGSFNSEAQASRRAALTPCRCRDVFRQDAM